MNLMGFKYFLIINEKLKYSRTTRSCKSNGKNGILFILYMYSCILHTMLNPIIPGSVEVYWARFLTCLWFSFVWFLLRLHTIFYLWNVAAGVKFTQALHWNGKLTRFRLLNLGTDLWFQFNLSIFVWLISTFEAIESCTSITVLRCHGPNAFTFYSWPCVVWKL